MLLYAGEHPLNFSLVRQLNLLSVNRHQPLQQMLAERIMKLFKDEHQCLVSHLPVPG